MVPLESAAAPTGAVRLEGVDRYRVWDPLFESVRVVLAHRGLAYSPEYVAGISGAAFRVAGICPCAPTCSLAMEPHDLVRLLGFECRQLSLESCGVPYERLALLAEGAQSGDLPNEGELEADLRQARRCLLELIEAVKAEIRAGRPAILWHAFTMAENDVVAGYDDAAGEFLGRGSYLGLGVEYARAPQVRTLRACRVGGWPAALFIGERRHPLDARAAEISALREAVRHARSDWNADRLGAEEWVMLEGLRCYDRWCDDFQDPGRLRTAGDAYCNLVYQTTHRAAAGFLREIAPRYPETQQALCTAAAEFEAEAEALAAGTQWLSWQSPEGPDAMRNARVAGLLRRAREHYARGIEKIERALNQIEQA